MAAGANKKNLDFSMFEDQPKGGSDNLDFSMFEETPKKKVPTEPVESKPTGQGLPVGSKTTPPTSGLESSQPSETDKVTVGGKEFEVPKTAPITGEEVRRRANLLFKSASPTLRTAIPDTDTALANLSKTAVKGNEDVLSAYVRTLPFEEQDRLRKLKFNDEESLEILNQATGRYLQSIQNNINVLKERGVESDLKTMEAQMKEIGSLRSEIEADQKAFQALQQTFLNQKGYGDLAKQYAEATAQIRKSEKQVQSILQQQKEAEQAINQFSPFIKGDQFTGSLDQYEQYKSAFERYNQLAQSPELQQYNASVERSNAIANQINKFVTPEYQERSNQLASKISDATTRYQVAVENFDRFGTPERRDNINQYITLLDDSRKLVTSLEAVKQKMPDVIKKEQDVLIRQLQNQSAVASSRGYDLVARLWNGFSDGVGKMLSAVPTAAGGLSEGYTMSDRVAESISDFFSPKITTAKTEVAGREVGEVKKFFDPDKDEINWSMMPEEVSDQAGTFLLLALTGGAGRMAQVSDAVSIVLPGTLLSYRDALETGKELYGEDKVGATLYASASSLITGITELIMPDRDILTGNLKKEISQKFVSNYLKGGRNFATREAIKTLLTNAGKEVTEELVDRWKDVVLRGAINLSGGDVDLEIPTLQEQLSIVASTAVLTNLGGVGGTRAESDNIKKLAVYQAAQNYPETLTQLEALESSGIDVSGVRDEVGKMFFQLKQIPTNLSAPKQIAIAEKMNAIDEIENINASGVSPVIAEIGNKKIKKIQGEIEAIINDPDYDKKFGEAVNAEVEAMQGGEVVNTPAIASTEGVDVAFTPPAKPEAVTEGVTETIQPDAVQIESQAGVLEQPEAESGSQVQQGNTQVSVQETAKKGEEEVAITELEQVKETLPDVSAGELAALIKDGTIPDMIERGVMDDLELMRLVDKLQLPMPQFLFSMDDGDRMGYRTEEDDAELLQLINRAQERTKMPLVEKTPQPTKQIEAQEERIKKAQQKVDDAAKWLKGKLKIDLPPGTKKMGVGQDEFIDLVANATKALVERGIKTTDALNQVIASLREGKFLNAREAMKAMANTMPLLDAEMENVYVDKSGVYTVLKDANGFFFIRNSKGKSVSGGTYKRVLDEYKKNYRLDTGTQVDASGVSENEIFALIASESTNPQEILEAMAIIPEKATEEQIDPKDVAIADNIGWVKTESFIGNSDKNLLKKGDESFDEVGDNIKLNYLRKNGESVDQVAQRVEVAMTGDYGNEVVTPDDIIDFIFRFPKGPRSVFNQKNPTWIDLSNRFYELTGFYPTKDMIDNAGQVKQDDTDFAGLEPAADTEGTPTTPSERKKRRFTKQVMTSPDVSGQAKAKITFDATFYTEQPNTLSLAEANEILRERGVEDVRQAFLDGTLGIHGAVRSVLGQVLIRHYESRGQYEEAVNLLEIVTKEATSNGQFIQAFALWARLTPQGQLIVAQRSINDQRSKRSKKDKKRIAKAQKAIRDMAKEASAEAVNTALGKDVPPTTKRTFASKNKIFTKDKFDNALKNIRKLGLFSMPFSEDALTVVGAIIEDGTIKFADFSKEVTRLLSSKVQPYLKDLYKEAKKRLVDSGIIDASEFSTDAEIDAEIDRLQTEKRKQDDQRKGERIKAKLEKAIKEKNDKLFLEAIAEIDPQSTLWGQYKNFAITRLKTLGVNAFMEKANESPAMQEFINGLVKNLREKLSEGLPEKKKAEIESRPAISLIADAFKNIDEYSQVWEDTRKALQHQFKDDDKKLAEIDAYFGPVLDTPFSQKQVTKAIKEGLKEMDLTITEIVKNHYTIFDAAKQTLTDKLIEQAGLNEADAKKLADAISKEFDRLVTEKRKKLLDALTKSRTITKDAKPILESELLNLLNLGGFSDADFMSAWAKANGYPELTDANIKEITRLADLIARYDDGFEKFRAMEDLLAYQAMIKGVSWKDLWTSIWYAHVLSGYETQKINFLSTAINSFIEYMVMVARQPLDSIQIAQGWWNGIARGFLEGSEVLRDGYNPIRGKLEIPATLEIMSRLNKGKFHYAHAAKYVRRVMVASDVLFFEGAREMKAYQQALKESRQESKQNPSVEVRKRALALLNKTDFDLQNARLEAQSEYDQKVSEIESSGVKGDEKTRLLKQARRDRARRVSELLEHGRSLEMQQDAKEFAAFTTYNHPPKGLLGVGARAVNVATSWMPALRFVVPFTNIIANVANQAINFTPLGYIRASRKFGGITGVGRDTELTFDQRADLMTRATIGMMGMSLVFALTFDWDEEDDAPAILEITGSGTGDFKKNYNLKEDEWQEYSIRIWQPETKSYSAWFSYRYTPFLPAFSIIGFIRDAQKYRKGKFEDMTDLIPAAMMAGMRSFLDMTFVSSINTFFDVLYDQYNQNKWDKAYKMLLNIGKGFVMPNLYTQTAKEIQSIKGIGIKETTLRFSDPKTYIATFLQDIPYARNIYQDRINALGEIIIPRTGKFYSDELFFDREPSALWKLVAEKNMINLSVPSIKVVKAIDPETEEETFLTDKEYYEFCVKRGTIIKEALQSALDGKKVYKDGKRVYLIDVLDQEWMTETQKNATKEAKKYIENMRIDSLK